MLRKENLNSRGGETSQDYIFHYKLDLAPEKTPVYHHRLTELVRAILGNLLNIILPLKAGKATKVDAFRWLTDKENVYQLFAEAASPSESADFAEKGQGLSLERSGSRSTFQNASNAAFHEPRVDLIKKLIESLSTVIEFEHEGEVVKVDGFRLKNLGDWLVPSAGDPSEVLEYAGSRCSCDCIFCCNKGNPPTVAACNNLNRTADEEFEEIKTRIKYFSPEARQALFPGLGCIYETTAHPCFIDALHLLREKTSKPFKITTNGSNLTSEIVANLAQLKPLYLYLSLNS